MDLLVGKQSFLNARSGLLVRQHVLSCFGLIRILTDEVGVSRRPVEVFLNEGLEV